MGLTNSKSYNETETINWNNIKTENVSSTLPNFNGLSNDAKQLIASLNIPEITESEVSEFTVNNILEKINSGLNKDDQSKFNQLLEEVSSQTASEDLSNTSPFISSEMYDYLIGNKNQQGGAKKSKAVKKGGSKNDDSETSSTSSDSDLKELLDSSSSEKNEKKEKKNKKQDSESELTGGELSYLSSSAHTDRDFSDSASTESQQNKLNGGSSEPLETDSETQNSTVSDENNQEMLTTSANSVNTSDINMVSDY